MVMLLVISLQPRTFFVLKWVVSGKWWEVAGTGQMADDGLSINIKIDSSSMNISRITTYIRVITSIIIIIVNFLFNYIYCTNSISSLQCCWQHYDDHCRNYHAIEICAKRDNHKRKHFLKRATMQPFGHLTAFEVLWPHRLTFITWRIIRPK